MRSLFGFLVFTTVLVALLAAVAVPALAGPVVVAAVRSASPFGDQPLEVEVDVDAIGLLRGFVSEIRISGSDLTTSGATIDTLDLTARGVGLEARDFQSVVGSLGSIDVPDGAGATIRVESVSLAGPSGAVEARAHLGAAETMRVIHGALADAGYELGALELVEGGVHVELLGQRVIVVPAVMHGGLHVPSVMGMDSIPVIVPAVGDAWRIATARVSPTGLEINALVDTRRLLGQD
jgi:hypothetical protein